MIGFKADPRRVDYWTYGKALSLDEIKQRPIWNTFSEAIKAEFEAAAARGPAELERMRALRAAYRAREAAEKEAQDWIFFEINVEKISNFR